MSDSNPNRSVRLRLSIQPIRDGVIVGLVLFIVALVGIVSMHHRGATAYEDEVRLRLLDTARAAASVIDADQHQLLNSPEQSGSELHQRMIAQLSVLLEIAPGIRYAYTMALVDDQVYFVLDAPSPIWPQEDMAGVMELYEDADPEMLEALRTGRALLTKDFYSDQWGTFISAYAPLRNSAGEQVGILGIDMAATEYHTRLTEMRRAALFSIGIGLLLSGLGGITAGYLCRRIKMDREQREDLITALRRREAELHKLSMVAARTDNGVLIADVEGRIEWINDGFTRITEYTFDEVVGRRPDELLHGPETDQAAVALLLDGLRQGEARTTELINYSRSGRQFWMRVELQPVHDDSGKIVNYMSIESDITERKRMEQALRQSEQHLRALIETTPACVKVVAADGTVDEMNAAGLKMIEADDPSQVIGKRYLEMVMPEDRNAFTAFHERICRGEHAQLEFEIAGLKGSRRWMLSHAVPLVDPTTGQMQHLAVTHDITERKEAERQLRESEERLRGIASQVPGALYQFRMAPDGTRTIPYISDGVIELCGISREELDHGPSAIMNGILPEDVDSVEASIVESARTLQPWRTEFRIRHRDGSIRWIGGNSIPQREPDGSILWHGLIIDITEQKDAEEKLHRLTAILEATPDLVGMANAELEPSYLNPAGRRMLDIGADEDLTNTKVADYFTSWAANILENVAIPSALRDGIWVGETALLRDKGSELPVSQVVIAHKDADGNIAYLSTIARDMSRQKHAEENLRRSKTLLRSTLDALSAHIAILDSGGRIIEVNEAWRQFATENDLNARHFGIGTNYISTCESATGQNADDASKAAEGIRRILCGEIDHFDLEYPCHGPDEQRWFALRATHFEATDGRCAVVAHENITESKLATDELERARDAAEAANRAKSEFLANMSHEIRTPMTAMLGYADLIMDSSLDEAERRRYLDVIHRNGNHLLGVINDILDISKIESGRMTVEHVPASPASILQEAASLMHSNAMEKNLSLDLEFVTDIPESINTDPVRLRQILLNLIGNAIKFTERGGVRVVARYNDATESGPQLTFEFIDTGIGLSEQQKTKLFQPFTQADNSMSRRFGGTGLGLAISRRLARLIGGDIEITRTGSEGSTFTLRLSVEPGHPVRLFRPPNDGPVTHSDAKPHAPLPQLDCRILLAEDGLDSQRLLSFLLTKAGADVTIVGDGQVAMDSALKARETNEPFDLILMDMQMPVMDGYTATRRLRELGYDGLIVALTAHAMASDRENCLAAGCDDYLTKPIDRQTLVKSVHRYLHDHDVAA